jgi:hypothetical protein
MTAHQLGADGFYHLLKIKSIAFFSDLGMEHHLQKQIPEFFRKVLIGAVSNCIYQLMGFFQHIRNKGAVGLLEIPGATTFWIPQLGYYSDQFLKSFHDY